MALCESVNLSEVPLNALRTKTRCAISQMLNATKVIPSPTGLPRDWRGLAHIAGSNLPPSNSCDPTSNVLEKWANCKTSFKDLVEAFKEIDRWDVLYDTYSSLENDASEYLNSKDSNKQVLATDSDVDKIILTVDDIHRTQNGLAPQMYDAFLLYSDDDVEFAMEMVNKLEKGYGLKLCLKDRDLVGGITFEHDAIMRLISERCNRLIIIVSPSFLDSPANKFFVTFAQALGIKQGQRKIIPCIYKRLPLPPQLDYYYLLDYTRKSHFWDFWEKLSRSVVSLPRNSVYESNAEPAVRIRELSEEENKELTVDIRKPEEWSCPVKNSHKQPILTEQERKSSLPKTDHDDECKVSVKSVDNATSCPKNSTVNLFSKVFPKSFKEKKSRVKNIFKKKKKAVLAN